MPDAATAPDTAPPKLDIGSMDTDLDKAVRRAVGLETQSFEKAREVEAKAAPQIEKNNQSINDIVASMPMKADVALPQKPVVPPKPTPVQEDPWANFGSTASVLGILGSLLLKQPIETALNASASAMKAKNDGDYATYERQYKEWQDATALAYKQSEWESRHLQDAMSLMTTNANLANAKIKAIGAATGNQFLLTNQDMKLTGEYVKSLTEASKSLQDRNFKIQELQMKEGYYKWLESGGKMGTSLNAMKAQAATLRAQADGLPEDDPDKAVLISRAESIEKSIKDVAKQTTAPSMLSDSAIDVAAKTYLMTGQMPSLGMGGQTDRAAVLNRAGELAQDQNTSVEDILAGRASYKADSASLTNIQKMADANEAFLQTMDKNIDIIKQLADKGSGTDAGPVVNRWLQAGRVATGDPDVAAFNAAVVTVQDEWAKILSGNTTGGQRITDSARNQVEGTFGPALSWPQLQTVLDKTVVPESNNRVKALREQLSQIKGRIGKTGSEPGVAPSEKFSVGQIINKGGKQYRVIGGDLNGDPDVEPVQ